ncbi:MAG TPA: glycosyltransferase family 39 protein [Rhizomicrobium sp.]|jgi:4-amino-4-deoxy-L-arabinose transferase-like glycosyltransferase|nr:glycosyltransferase family 39 protein [Rhizomicrobium sp.]
MSASRAHPADRRALQFLITIVLTVTFVRCTILLLSPLNLYPDEAQYWWWAQSPDLGYFSKPPMIAWVIRLSTILFGDSEWAIRIASPVLHGATAILVFFLSRRVMTGWHAGIAAIAYLTLPGVSYSSGLISTDVPLLFFWALALYAFLRACDERNWHWPVLAGVALGLGLLSKYAMLYYLAGAAMAAFWSLSARRYVLSTRGLVTLLIAAIVFAPNAVWNAVHGFPTVAHTAANADWGRSRFSLTGVAVFAIGQLGVFGPILMAGWIGALGRLARRSDRSEPNVILAAFSLPPLVLILVQAFLARANANWAATAYVAATPLAVAELLRWWRARALWVSFAINGAVLVALWIFLARPDVADSVGLGNAFKREEGWRQLGAEAASAAAAVRYDAIVAENRSIAAELLYYARPRRTPVRVWSRDLIIRDHFEMTMRLEAGANRTLLILEPGAAKRVLATFDSSVLVKTVATPIGGHHQRVTALYDASHYRGPQLHA